MTHASIHRRDLQQVYRASRRYRAPLRRAPSGSRSPLARTAQTIRHSYRNGRWTEPSTTLPTPCRALHRRTLLCKTIRYDTDTHACGAHGSPPGHTPRPSRPTRDDSGQRGTYSLAPPPASAVAARALSLGHHPPPGVCRRRKLLHAPPSGAPPLRALAARLELTAPLPAPLRLARTAAAGPCAAVLEAAILPVALALLLDRRHALEWRGGALCPQVQGRVR